MSSSLSLPKPVAASLRLAWSVALGVRLRGLSLAREIGCLLTWDDRHWLCVINRSGQRQGQVGAPAALVSACSADTGSAHVVIGVRGEVWWLAPDLSIRWERTVGEKAVAVAVDPHGHYAAVCDARGRLYVLDEWGRDICQSQAPRPLHHLAFVPAAPFLVGSSDYGLVACFDLSGRCVWRDGLVAHVGSLATSGDGEWIALACFTEGLQSYTLAGKNLGRSSLGEPCRLACLDYAGTLSLSVALSNRLMVADRDGQVQCTHMLEKTTAGVALDPLGRHAFVALVDGTVLSLEYLSSKPA